MSPWYNITTSNAGSVMAPSFIPKFQQEVAHFKHNYFFTLQLHVHVLSLINVAGFFFFKLTHI